MIKLLKSSHTYLVALFFSTFLCFSCSDGTEEIEEVIEKEVEEEMEEVLVDTVFTLAAGNYKGLWDSRATGGAVFSELAVTATLEEAEEGTFTGILYISDDFTSCCGGDDGDGPITFTVLEHQVTFEWKDEIADCTGTFSGSGTLTADNTFRVNITGTDCDGDHTGSIRFFE